MANPDKKPKKTKVVYKKAKKSPPAKKVPGKATKGVRSVKGKTLAELKAERLEAKRKQMRKK
ncbi:MAG: hypothetical protein ACTSQF_00035 [Candidatus Heimdallarchaeaceae archaeon]